MYSLFLFFCGLMLASVVVEFKGNLLPDFWEACEMVEFSSVISFTRVSRKESCVSDNSTWYKCLRLCIFTVPSSLLTRAKRTLCSLKLNSMKNSKNGKRNY